MSSTPPLAGTAAVARKKASVSSAWPSPTAPQSRTLLVMPVDPAWCCAECAASHQRTTDVRLGTLNPHRKSATDS